MIRRKEAGPLLPLGTAWDSEHLEIQLASCQFQARSPKRALFPGVSVAVPILSPRIKSQLPQSDRLYRQWSTHGLFYYYFLNYGERILRDMDEKVFVWHVKSHRVVGGLEEEGWHGRMGAV